MPLVQETIEQRDLPVGHVNDVLDRVPESIIRLEIRNFTRQIAFYGLLDTVVKKLPVSCGVKIAAVVCGVVLDPDIAGARRLPVYALEERARIGEGETGDKSNLRSLSNWFYPPFPRSRPNARPSSPGLRRPGRPQGF